MALRPALTLAAPARPSSRRLGSITMSPAAAPTTIPLVPATRTEATCPPPPSSVIDFVIVTAPKPPGSSASISPPPAVFEIAPPKVLHGAVRLQGLASSPTPDTHVRLAWACSAPVTARKDPFRRRLQDHPPRP